MIRILVFAIIGIVFIFIFTEIIKFLTAISGTKSQMIKDKNTFLRSLDRKSLVEWPWPELSTLSTSLDYGLSKYDMITSAQEASYQSIYSERIAYMLSKKYGDKELMLIITKTTSYELFLGDNGDVSLTIDKGKSIPVEFTNEHLQFELMGHKYILENVRNRGEIQINNDSILFTNEDIADGNTLNRLVPVQPDDVNSMHHSIVKFLLLFYLIWRQQ